MYHVFQATIAAIGILSDNPRAYGALPFMVSGTCKREDAGTHAKLIETLIKACKSEESKIGSFLNLLVGDDDITADKDYKHVIKRLRNFLLRKRGTIVYGVHITPSLLRFHLKLAGNTESRLNYLFNPNDRQ